MSQIYKPLTSSGPIPPIIATSYVTDVGTAIPAANILNVPSNTSNTNTVNGIQTTGAGNTLTVQLTNRITAKATTTDGVTPVILYSFPLGATPGTYLFTQRIVGYNITSSFGAVYSGFRGVRTTGAAGILINSNQVIVGEEDSFVVSEVVNSISGNNAVLTVTGVTGQTIDWNVVTEYIFIS